MGHAVKKINLMFALLAVSCSATPMFAQSGSGGVIVGDSPQSFFGSGAQVDPIMMEEASIPADRAVSLGPDHKVRPPKPGQKQGGFFHSIGKAFAHTSNFIGFPVGPDNDVDASLSSNLPNEINQAARDQQAAEQQAAQNAHN